MWDGFVKRNKNLRVYFLFNGNFHFVEFLEKWSVDLRGSERRSEMGLVSTIMGFFGFVVGISIGLLIGYFLFIYFQIQPNDVNVSFSVGVRVLSGGVGVVKKDGRRIFGRGGGWGRTWK